MTLKRRSRLSDALDRAHRALDDADRNREPRAMRALGSRECRTTQSVAPDSLFDPLVQDRSRRLRTTVAPTTLALADRFDAVGRELSRTGLWNLVLRLRQRGDRFRAAMFDDHPQEDDDA